MRLLIPRLLLAWPLVWLMEVLGRAVVGRTELRPGLGRARRVRPELGRLERRSRSAPRRLGGTVHWQGRRPSEEVTSD